METINLLIAGRDVPASGSATFNRLNPISGEVATRAAAASVADARAAVDAAAAAFPKWSAIGPSERRAKLNKAADLLESRAAQFASILTTETDVMILAHHGADNGFTTKKFLAHLEPSLAICSADYDNQYDHPREEIRELLHEQGIRLMTTKTGDVIVRSSGDHTGAYQAINLIEKSGKELSRVDFVSKKSGILDANGDTLRQRYGLHKSYPR